MLVAAAVLFGLMAFVAKRASLHIPGTEVALVRFVVGLLCVAAAGLTAVKLRPVNLRNLALRGIFGGIAVLLFFVAIEELPVGIATLLNYTAPVFTAIDAGIFLGEKVSRATALALALTMLGVVLVVVGGATGASGFAGFGIWELCGLASAVLSGAAVTAIRVARRTDGSWEIFGAFCLFGALVTAPMAARTWVWPSAYEWLLLVCVGLLAVAAQLLFTHALREVKAAVSGVIMQLTPVTALVLGALFNHDRITALAAFGAALTICAVAYAAWASSVAAAAESTVAARGPKSEMPRA